MPSKKKMETVFHRELNAKGSISKPTYKRVTWGHWHCGTPPGHPLILHKPTRTQPLDSVTILLRLHKPSCKHNTKSTKILPFLPLFCPSLASPMHGTLHALT